MTMFGRVTYRMLVYIFIVNVVFLYVINQNWSSKLVSNYSDFSAGNGDNKRSKFNAIKRFTEESIIRSNPLRCSHIPKPDPEDVVLIQDRWQLESSDSGKFFIYSVFYDDRPLAGNLPFIRINMMATYAPQMKAYCHLWYEDYPDEAFIISGEINETGMNRYYYESYGYYWEYIVSCKLPFKNVKIIDNKYSQYNSSSCLEYFESDGSEIMPSNSMLPFHNETLIVCDKKNVNNEEDEKEKYIMLIPEYVSVSRDVTCKPPQNRQKLGNSQRSSQFSPQENHHKSLGLKYHTTLQAVYYEYHEKPLHEFGICVVNGHGKYKQNEMVEWFEFHKMIGVTEFNLYNTSYIGMESIFTHYENEEHSLVLSQLPHPLGLKPKDSLKISKIRNLRTISMNDCMMRNMYRYKYLLLIDHDEFVVPRGNITNLHDILVSAEKNVKTKTRPIMSYSFFNAYFFLSFKPDKYKSDLLKTVRFRLRNKPLPEYYGSKSIISPLFCFNLMNHYCYVRLPLYKGEVTNFISTDLALSHHYRFCGRFLVRETCNELHEIKILDDTMLKFENLLTEKVTKVSEHLNITLL